MKNKQNPANKGNIVISFFKSVRHELYQVTWPTKDETIRLTGLVLIASVAVGIYLGALDYVFSQVVSVIIK